MELESSDAEGLSKRIATLEKSLSDELKSLHEEMRESRRHAQILFESTRDDIRLVADAVAGLTIKFEALSKRL